MTKTKETWKQIFFFKFNPRKFKTLKHAKNTPVGLVPPVP